MTTTDITTNTTVFDDITLGGISSFDEAMALVAEYAESTGAKVERATDYGTGFKVAENKDALVGVDFVILQWRFNEGDFGGNFVSAECVTKNGDKYILNDGGTGIRAQLEGVTAQRIKNGDVNTHAVLLVPGGLTKSAFFYNEDTRETRTRLPEGASAGKGGWGPAFTYYLAS